MRPARSKGSYSAAACRRCRKVRTPAKPDFIGLAHQGCHPERSEGSRGEILRYAQNDTAERLYREVYQCYVFRLSSSWITTELK